MILPVSIRNRLAVSFLFFICLLSAPAGFAYERTDVALEINKPDIPGLVVEIHREAMAPQLVMAYQGSKVVEILDEDGRAFLRLSKQGAEVDIAAAAFHLTRIPGGADVNKGTLSTRARWRPASKEPSYGWFDSRIDVSDIKVPPGIRTTGLTQGREMPFGDWTLPLRVDGQRRDLTGFYVYVPPPRGMIQASLLSASPAPGVTAQLAPGITPALMLSNTGKDVVTVFDSKGEPFLRIGPAGVEANLSSLDWPESRLAGQPEGRGWRHLSKKTSHTWLEVRAAWRGRPPPPDQPAGRLREWSVPLQIGEQKLELKGAIDWRPFSQKAAPQPAPK